MMHTQRVNAYRNRTGICYYIEEFNPQHNTWYTVGDTYTRLQHAMDCVERHNLVELLKAIDNLEEI